LRLEITDEDAIKLLPAGAWAAAVDQDGAVQSKPLSRRSRT